ncbi:hypothetical protein IAU60_006333 [Kwoniella sp. DSM 27419]
MAEKSDKDLPVQIIDVHEAHATRPLDKDTFSFINVFSLAFSCINSWVALVAGLGAVLNSGGPTAANMVVSMILVNNPDFVLTPAKQYAIYVAMCLFGPLTAQGVGSRTNRIIETGLMVLSVGGSIIIAITLLATAQTKASGSSYAFIGFDIIYHVSEEVENPKKEGPRAANWTIAFSGVSTWFIILCILFCISDVERVTGTKLGWICMDATGSRAATTIFILILLIIFSNAPRGNTISASRTLLAFGRDGMLPFADWFMVVKFGEPIWGSVLSVIVALLVGLVQFGPAAAFNSLLGGATIFSFVSYSE